MKFARSNILFLLVYLYLSFLAPSWINQFGLIPKALANPSYPTNIGTCVGMIEVFLKENTDELDHVILHNVHHTFYGVQPLKYEMQLAAEAELSVEEVMGITRNFHHTIVTTGDTGVARIKNNIVLLPDKNLIRAYKEGMALLDLERQITVEDIIQLRKWALETHYFRRGRKVVEEEFRLRNAEDKAYLMLDEVHETVLETLRTNGCTVELKNLDEFSDDFLARLKLKPGTEQLYVVTYPDENVILESIRRFAERLNNLIQSRAPPEYIASYAVQELLIIHPFKEGNGRTARLLGQILYKKLTDNTLIFPREFHREMNYTLRDLTLLLFNGEQLSHMDTVLHSAADSITAREIFDAVFWQEGILPRIAEPRPMRELSDVRPGRIIADEQEFLYDELPPSVITSYQEHLFFGKGFNTITEAQGHSRSMFSRGWQRSVDDNVDLSRHLHSTREYRSSFIQSSRSFEQSKSFHGDKRFVISIIIDPRGAAILDLNSFFLHALGYTHRHSRELEVVFYKNLPPNRVLGAVITDRTEGRVVDVMINPHYSVD